MFQINIPKTFLICISWIANLLSAASLATKLEFSERLMGTEVRIVVDAENTQKLRDTIRSAYEEGNRLNKIFSDWNAESELSCFSRSSQFGHPFVLSEELHNVLLFSQTLARKTNGAFDVTIGPISRLWRIARHQKRLPNSDDILTTLKRTGYKKLLISDSNNSARLLLPGMVVDLGGIAKGYIADRMLNVMKMQGFRRCLIDAGGDLTMGDPPRASKGWKIEVGGISDSSIPPLELSNCAVATSGDIEQFLEYKGKRYSHLLDPRTGRGVVGRRQVTIVSSSGMIADAYASACLILGRDKAGDLLSELPFFKMYYLFKEGSSENLEIFCKEKSKSDKEL